MEPPAGGELSGGEERERREELAHTQNAATGPDTHS